MEYRLNVSIKNYAWFRVCILVECNYLQNVCMRAYFIIFLGSEVYRWFDGHHHYDEICLRTGIQDQMDLQNLCDNDPEIVIIRR